MNSREYTQELTVEKIISSDNYVIPIYQRDYAWRNNEITQLVQDVADCATSECKDSPYYIGTLVAYKRNVEGNVKYEIIDGQQRFTTMIILISVLRNELKQDVKINLNLRFDCRDKSSNALDYIISGQNDGSDNLNQMIIQGYKDAHKAIIDILNNAKLSAEEFKSYLLKKVTILRVLVPEDTDLNHYFEVMNTRGEQLEKHEVLKARCLNVLDEKERHAFNLAWEACSDMERYVQYKFEPTLRKSLFGDDLNKLVTCDMYYELASQSVCDNTSNESNNCTVEELLSCVPINKPADKTDELSSERFNTIINFSNFLLHILRSQTAKDIPLDDKRLINIFEGYGILDDKNAVKRFGYALLQGKFLFDKYIIKREFLSNKDEWSLKRMKTDGSRVYYVNTFGEEESIDKSASDINRRILMILSMFHVSAPTLVYKHWLNASLKYLLDNSSKVEPNNYYDYLFTIAKRFMKYNFVATDNNRSDYYDMIYNWKDNLEATIDYSLLDKGTNVPNFIFNFTDFLLWLESEKHDSDYIKIDNTTLSAEKTNKIKIFEFTFRSSVEHYYPQHPIDGNKIKLDICDNFGNLCLISTSKNSRLSNHLPSAKKDYYSQNDSIDSIKQYLMMQYPEWDICGINMKNEIEEHGRIMKKLLETELATIK